MSLQKYLERIECQVRPPSLDHLSELQQKHLQHLPFETLSLHLGQPIELNIDALLEKILDRKRGGFCYELNSAFAWLLKSLGYDVRLIMSQPFKGDGTLAPPFAHLALKVVLDGQAYLVDVGFNDGSVHPFPILEGHVENGCTLQKEGEVWTYIDLEREKNLYVFTEQEHPLEDFFEMCTYYSNSAESGFRKKMFCGFQVQGRKDYLTDHKWVEGSSERLLDEQEFASKLRDFYGVPLDDAEIQTLYAACLQRAREVSPVN
ncbi:arylamine N-acetyltransferase family protein [Deinococcus cellulosilyticus]|uniref:N-hydroxyarylamine O-acetyltransferase n=1 Tax=Deinococcus cellulosilyticus (strain DSM 18568 / NBRC 106333 / KACC 11606 / 5516J-15) TaxID=1223518 RepID=A0A511N8Y9_DEIC1|nr:arylamine N-acetyltransferase [Deinococcus cellulosilyticus]GEM48948.1 N-hydroxyarylamine O-acetyltransferase [Deinococcus cellulosilyticus NBRC 106333 = KACC 11606]